MLDKKTGRRVLRSASAHRGQEGQHFQSQSEADLSQRFSAGDFDKSLSLRKFSKSPQRMYLSGVKDSKLSAEGFGSDAGSDRYLRRDAADSLRRAGGDRDGGEFGRDQGEGRAGGGDPERAISKRRHPLQQSDESSVDRQILQSECRGKEPRQSGLFRRRADGAQLPPDPQSLPDDSGYGEQ